VRHVIKRGKKKNHRGGGKIWEKQNNVGWEKKLGKKAEDAKTDWNLP